MPPRNWRLRIEDILEAIQKTQRYKSGLSFEEFCSDEQVVDAVVRNLEVIGEAARHIPPEIELRHPDVPWGEMRGMRNVLVHEYFGLEWPIVWAAATEDAPALRRQIAEILRGELPGKHVVASCEVLPVFREYERFSTTVVSAAVGGLTER